MQNSNTLFSHLLFFKRRKRKKGCLKIEDSEGSAVDQQGNEDEIKEDYVVKSTEKTEEKQKKKSDDLWASFLSEVGPRPKTSVSPSADSQQVKKMLKICLHFIKFSYLTNSVLIIRILLLHFYLWHRQTVQDGVHFELGLSKLLRCFKRFLLHDYCGQKTSQ